VPIAAFLFSRELRDVNLDNMSNRIEVFRQMLEADPDNTMVMFGLAKEYEKLGDHASVIELLETYLAKADDEGNAYGVLANAYLNNGDREKAIETYRKGIDVSLAHGHPSMANEFRMTIELDLAE
jgi:tetratricopeptide (TPR) repeat protein